MNAAAAEQAPMLDDEQLHVPPEAMRYLRSTDAPELCECQRPLEACDCRYLFAELAR